MEIKKELLDIVSEYVDVPVDEIDTSAGLKFSTGMDSFVMLSMVASVEEHFCIRIPNEKLSELKTLDDFIALIGNMKVA